MKVLEMIERLQECNPDDEVYLDFEETDKYRGVKSLSHLIMADDGVNFVGNFSMDIKEIKESWGDGNDEGVTIIPDTVIRC